ncbi:MAG TPA: hypothetical protein VMJ52_15950 [Xanthobacteraceae bacterium]|nr:hypothetical protein [Xanthobacteraceae bacterium]
MTATVLAICAAYVVLAVLLLGMGLTSRFVWWVKAAAIIVTTGFFVEAFFATKSLLGWPGTGQLPPKFQLLWTRVVEPDPKLGERGSVYLWIEEVDENNVPSGLPRSYRLPYTRPLADRSNKARDEIMSGNPQEGTADDMTAEESRSEMKAADNLPQGERSEAGTSKIEMTEALRQAQHVEFRAMGTPLLPPKP